jgi:hypothetical protein
MTMSAATAAAAPGVDQPRHRLAGRARDHARRQHADGARHDDGQRPLPGDAAESPAGGGRRLVNATWVAARKYQSLAVAEAAGFRP